MIHVGLSIESNPIHMCILDVIQMPVCCEVERVRFVILCASHLCQVIDQALAGAPEGKEAKEDYLKRLRAVAKSLPPRYIEKLIESIPARIQSVLDAKGFTPKKD